MCGRGEEKVGVPRPLGRGQIVRDDGGIWGPARLCQGSRREYSGSASFCLKHQKNHKLFLLRDLHKEWSQTSNKSVTGAQWSGLMGSWPQLSTDLDH